MKIKGNLFTGTSRGQPLVEIYFFRLVNILGFEPFKGTMDIKMERPVDVKLYATKRVESTLLDGSLKVDAYLAPVIFSAKGQDYECWAIRQPKPIYGEDTLEIIAKDNLREKFSLNDGDEVEITFFEQVKKKRNIPGLGIVKKIYGVESQIKR